METSSMDNGRDLSVHRNSLSYIVRHLYAAVQSVKDKSQGANLTLICKYMQQYHALPAAVCIAQLKSCVSEGLLQVVKTAGKKKSQKPNDQEEYVIPDYEKAGHDWYCFECHMGGPVIHCSYCHRVFHTQCFKGICAEKKLCYVCECPIDCTRSTKQNLNRILGFLCKNVNEFVSDALEGWKILKLNQMVMNVLIYNQMDWYTIQQKTSKLEYRHVQEFKADVQTFLHNVVIYYGDKNPFTEEVKKMIVYCERHFKEIEMCDDCYASSNCKKDKNWFCKPCKTPHKLVYGKLESHPYEFWPAKVIEQKNDMYVVKFFGSQHKRARLSKSHVKPLNPDLEELRKWADSPAKRIAHRELKIHIVSLGRQMAKEGRVKGFKKTGSVQTVCNSGIIEKRKQNNMIEKIATPRSAVSEKISSLPLPSTRSELRPKERDQQTVQEAQDSKRLSNVDRSVNKPVHQNENGNGINQMPYNPEPQENEESSPDIIFDCVIVKGQSGPESDRKYIPKAIANKIVNDTVAEARERHRERSRRLKALCIRKLNEAKKRFAERQELLHRLQQYFSKTGITYIIHTPRRDGTNSLVVQHSSFHDRVP